MKVELIAHDHEGDLAVVNAARVSFDKFHEVWQEGKDDKLVAFLAREGHVIPFAHTYLKFRIEAPLFVARQLGKHQVGFVWNEVSRRYVDSKPEFYNPVDRRYRAVDKKQGSGSVMPVSDYWESIVDAHNRDALSLYNDMIAAEVCPEQARMVLPQSMMTTWIWTGNVLGFSRVLNLRLKSDTQAETREVAQQIHTAMLKTHPVSTMSLVKEYA